jgi:DNA-binding transcriptional LysR family regulator
MARNPQRLDFAALDLNLLKVFDAIMIDLNLTQAAARLGKGVPAVSQALARLRVVIDDPLFNSHGRGMRPTPRAVAIAPIIRASLDQLKDALTSAPTFDEQTADRTFTIDVHGGTDFVLAPLLYGYAAQHAPGVKFRILSDKATVLRNELRYGETELALDFEPFSGEGIQSEAIYTDPFCLIAKKGHPAIPRDGPISKKTLQSLQHVGIAWARTFDGNARPTRLQQAGLDLDFRMIIHTLGAIPPIIESTDLVILATEKLAKHSAKRWNTESFALDFEIEPLIVSLVWHERYNMDAGHGWLRQAMKNALNDV